MRNFLKKIKAYSRAAENFCHSKFSGEKSDFLIKITCKKFFNMV